MNLVYISGRLGEGTVERVRALLDKIVQLFHIVKYLKVGLSSFLVIGQYFDIIPRVLDLIPHNPFLREKERNYMLKCFRLSSCGITSAIILSFLILVHICLVYDYFTSLITLLIKTLFFFLILLL